MRDWERRAADPDYAATHATTLREALGRLLTDRENKGRAQATLTFYRSKAGHLLRLFGHETTLAAVNAARVDDYIAIRLSEGAARHTIYKELVTLRGTLKVAKRRGEFTGDIDAIMPDGFSPAYKPRERTLASDAAKRLLVELRPDRAAQVAFIIATGARRSEAVSAMREDIDWQCGVVHLRGTKTSAAKRAVPIAGFTVELLQFVERNASGDDGRLFNRWTNVDRDLKAARVRAERSAIEAQLKLEERTLESLSTDEKAELLKRVAISPNDLRRTYATWLRTLGIEPHLLALALGHRDSRMVERVYGRLEPEALRSVFQLRLGTAATLALPDRAANQQTSSAPVSQNHNAVSNEQGYRPLTFVDQLRRQQEQDAWQHSESTSAGKSGGAGTTMQTALGSASPLAVAINGPPKR